MNDQDLFAILVRAAAQLTTTAEKRLQDEAGLPFAHYQALRAVASVRDCRVFEVAAELSMTFGGASKLVDRLESTRLVSRHDNPHDHRSALLRLSPAGRDLLALADRIVAKEVSTTIGALPRNQRTALGQSLSALDDVLVAAGRVPSNHRLAI